MRANELYISFKDLYRSSHKSSGDAGCHHSVMTVLYLPKGRSSPKLQELVPINALSTAFIPSSSLAADLTQLQNLLQERAGYPVPEFSSRDLFMTVNRFFPHLAGKVIRSQRLLLPLKKLLFPLRCSKTPLCTPEQVTTFSCCQIWVYVLPYFLPLSYNRIPEFSFLSARCLFKTSWRSFRAAVTGKLETM